MKWVGILLLAIAAVLLLITAACFLMVFYVPKKQKKSKREFDIPPGKIYEPYREQMVTWMKETRALPHTEMSIQSFDGLTLRGNYYEYAPGAPIELMFHGYRGTAERDLCGGVQRCFSLGRSVLLVDQRASGNSEGHIISFGVNESRDCLVWVEHLVARFGPDVKIILTGISMGAATVMAAAGQPLPPNVIGVLADCGYTSPRAIIKKVIRQLKLPADLLYPFVRLSARLFGGFDLEERSPIEAMPHCRIPIIFVHGEDDDYVPCEMSHSNFTACAAPKALFTVPGAGHGLAYLMDREGYMQTLTAFSLRYDLPVATPTTE